MKKLYLIFFVVALNFPILSFSVSRNLYVWTQDEDGRVHNLTSSRTGAITRVPIADRPKIGPLLSRVAQSPEATEFLRGLGAAAFCLMDIRVSALDKQREETAGFIKNFRSIIEPLENTINILWSFKDGVVSTNQYNRGMNSVAANFSLTLRTNKDVLNSLDHLGTYAHNLLGVRNALKDLGERPKVGAVNAALHPYIITLDTLFGEPVAKAVTAATSPGSVTARGLFDSPQQSPVRSARRLCDKQRSPLSAPLRALVFPAAAIPIPAGKAPDLKAARKAVEAAVKDEDKAAREKAREDEKVRKLTQEYEARLRAAEAERNAADAKLLLVTEEARVAKSHMVTVLQASDAYLKAENKSALERRRSDTDLLRGKGLQKKKSKVDRFKEAVKNFRRRLSFGSKT